MLKPVLVQTAENKNEKYIFFDPFEFLFVCFCLFLLAVLEFEIRASLLSLKHFPS